MAWLEFDTDRDEVADRIIDLADGRTLFLPRGRGGPALLVPDEAARLRIHRIYTWLRRGMKVLGVVMGLAAFKFGEIAVALLILPVAWMTEWCVNQLAVGGLQQAGDPVALAATAPRGRAGVAASVAYLVCGGAMLIAAVWIYASVSRRTEVLLGLVGLGLTLVVGGARSLRQLRDPQYARTGFPLDNRPIVPR